MSDDYFKQLQSLCIAGNWPAAGDLWHKASDTHQQHPLYILAGMQIAAALWQKDIQDKVCTTVQNLDIPPQALLQVIETAAYYYQYEAISNLVDHALSSHCYNNNTILALGTIASRFNAFEQARKCFETAKKLGLGKDIINYNLAAMARYEGNKAQCQQHLSDCLIDNPMMVDAHYMLANLMTWSDSNNHIERLESLLEKIHEPVKKAQIYYAIAKEAEDCNNFDKAFSAMQLGGQVIKQNSSYQSQDDIAFLQAIQDNYPTHDAPARSDTQRRSSGCTPLFICGLPRTGSTLLERMLLQHSQIDSSGELNQFADLFMRRANQQFAEQQLSQTAMVKAGTNLDYAALGNDYLYSLDPQCTKEKYMIDKMPQNSIFVGSILSALPKAKIILIDRNPIDACLAMYKQIFQGIYEFSYDLDDLGAYVTQIRHLMKHWQDSYPQNVHILSYEQLVKSTEDTLNDACDFLGIKFESASLDFHQSEQISTTASAAQVRKKIYSTSIGKWRAYDKHLGKLKEYFPEYSD